MNGNGIRESVHAVVMGFVLLIALQTVGVFADVVIPLANKDKWQVLSYTKIPSNTVEFSKDGLRIDVDNSASPLVLPITPQAFQTISFDVEIEGTLNLGDLQQGDAGADDFLLRMGVVYEGKRTLGFFQRTLAARWIRQLFDLAPDGEGIREIQFFNVYSDDRLAGKAREHPLSELIKEYFVLKAPESGFLSATIKTNPRRRILALWISADGDDTDSKFKVTIKRISLHPIESDTSKSSQ